MAEFKIVLSDPKTGKSKQIVVKDADAAHFLGKKIGEDVKGELLELPGYEFKITGGSDFAGFPMRWDVEGFARKRIFTAKSLGVKVDRKGMKVKKTVAGNTIHEKTAQINMKVTKAGSKPLIEKEAPAKEEVKKEAPKEQPKAEPKKEEPKKEAKPAEKKEEKKEEPKKEAKPEAKKEAPKEEPKKEKPPEKKEVKVEPKKESKPEEKKA